MEALWRSRRNKEEQILDSQAFLHICMTITPIQTLRNFSSYPSCASVLCFGVPRHAASHPTFHHSLGRAPAAPGPLCFTSLESAHRNPAVLRRIQFRSGYIIIRFALPTAPIAFDRTHPLCFPPHCCLPFSFTPAPTPAPAAFAASSPRIFDAAMNLNGETEPSARCCTRLRPWRCGRQRPITTPGHPHRDEIPHLAPSSPPAISHRNTSNAGRGGENGPLTHRPTRLPSPARTPPARRSCRPGSPCRRDARSAAPAGRADGCIVCCG